MWANSLRAEVSDQGVEVSVIFPGFVKTNVSFNALNVQGNLKATKMKQSKMD
ncbi:short-chain dehydrogenase/reductase domain protein [Acinetobacter baumannii 923118]|nr:short-chain dehydrogenase/reductase domain protein [Acinetobacter baumannii 923118]